MQIKVNILLVIVYFAPVHERLLGPQLLYLLFSAGLFVFILKFKPIPFSSDWNIAARYVIGAGSFFGLLTLYLYFEPSSITNAQAYSALAFAKFIEICWIGVCEEIWFRYYALKLLHHFKFKIDNAIIVSAILFTVVHGNLSTSHALSGALFALSFVVTRSLIVPISLHIILNLLVSSYLCSPIAVVCLDLRAQGQAVVPIEFNLFLHVAKLIAIGGLVWVLVKRTDKNHLGFLAR